MHSAAGEAEVRVCAGGQGRPITGPRRASRSPTPTLSRKLLLSMRDASCRGTPRRGQRSARPCTSRVSVAGPPLGRRQLSKQVGAAAHARLHKHFYGFVVPALQWQPPLRQQRLHQLAPPATAPPIGNASCWPAQHGGGAWTVRAERGGPRLARACAPCATYLADTRPCASARLSVSMASAVVWQEAPIVSLVRYLRN